MLQSVQNSVALRQVACRAFGLSHGNYSTNNPCRINLYTNDAF